MATSPREQAPLPPAVKGRYLRNAIMRVCNTLGFFQWLHREYGGIVRYNIAHLEFCIIFDPDLIEELLFKNRSGLDKGYIYKRNVTFSKPTVITADDEDHRHLRRIIQPWFHRKALEQYAGTMAECAMAKREEWRHGQIIDANKELRDLTLSIGLKVFFDSKIQISGDLIRQVLKLLTMDFTLTLLPSRTLRKYILSQFFRRLQRAWDDMTEHIRVSARAARADVGERIDLVAFLACATNEDGEAAFSELEVVDEVIETVLAAHETSASSLAWTMYYLSQNQPVYNRLVQEIDDVLAGRPVALADYDRLIYTRAVIDEVMRLATPAYYIGRTSTKAGTIGGYFIPAGTNLQCCCYVPHRDERYFPQPEQFRPERWLEPQPERPKCAYMPFGAGSRGCAGEAFARMVMAFAVASIMQRWRIEYVLDGPPKIDSVGGYLIKGNLPFRVIDRQRDS